MPTVSVTSTGDAPRSSVAGTVRPTRSPRADRAGPRPIVWRDRRTGAGCRRPARRPRPPGCRGVTPTTSSACSCAAPPRRFSASGTVCPAMPRNPRVGWPRSRTCAAVAHAIAAGMATSKPRIAAAVETPITPPVASSTGPPAKPSCIGTVVRITCSIRAAAPGPQRSADDRDDAGARGQRVAPRTGDGQGNLADARRRVRPRGRGESESRRAQHGEAG